MHNGIKQYKQGKPNTGKEPKIMLWNSRKTF